MVSEVWAAVSRQLVITPVCNNWHRSQRGTAILETSEGVQPSPVLYALTYCSLRGEDRRESVGAKLA